MFPAVDFVLALILFGSFFAFHNVRAISVGMLVGFAIGVGVYTHISGFPVVYPKDFSYNAVAAVYMFGLFATLVFGWVTGLRVLTSMIALILLVSLAATTSIKSNLGVVIGAAGAGFIYFGQSLRFLRRNLFAIAVATGFVAYVITSNDAVVERFEAGIERVSSGLEVLRIREDGVGYTGFTERTRWMKEGIQAWASNPIFGYGVEAFRKDHEITSHSTPVDLLYNTGLIGILLFYGMLGSLIWRSLKKPSPDTRSLRALVLAGALCYVFVSLSGIYFYQTFLAAFVGMSAALIRRFQPIARVFNAGSIVSSS
jgi:O-antigen ligase